MREGTTTMHKCFHCGSRSVTWDCDYDYEDFGLEGKGIVQCLHCRNCGAKIQYYISCEAEENESEEQRENEE